MRRVFVVVVALGFVVVGVGGCSKDGGGNGSPAGPSPAPTPTVTRIIALEGDMNFGEVLVNTTAEKVVRIVNRGTGVLSVSGITGPGAGSVMTASWTQGQIQPNQWQDITFRFTPTAVQSYNGTLTVNGDQTSGTNTMPVTASGQRERWSRTGSGNQVFDMPTDVRRVRIIGHWDGRSNSNFIVRVSGQLIVNEILRERNPYDGTHSVIGGRTEITNSSGISWSFEELR